MKSKKKILDKQKLEKKVVESLSKILSVRKADMLKINDLSKLENWDSLKHLEIITVLDKILKNKLKKVKNPSELTNIKKIISLI